jgi:thioredoxin reductase
VSDLALDWLAGRVHDRIAALRRDAAANPASLQTRPGRPAGWAWPAPVAAALLDGFRDVFSHSLSLRASVSRAATEGTTTRMHTTTVDSSRATTGAGDLPVVVVGAGPIGLAAAAHLRGYGLTALVLEAGDRVGSAVREWGHIRMFTAWRHIVDAAAEKLLAPTGWTRPDGDVPPTGAEIVEQYLEPLAAVLGSLVVTGVRVVAVSRDGLDGSRTLGRDERPFLVRVQGINGEVADIRARAVIDASGTWGQRDPLGASGLPALGEPDAEAAGLLVGPVPDVLGIDRARFAGRRTLVVGMGHSAANTLLSLAELAHQEPGTEVVWAIRGTDPRRLYGSGDDQLRDRARLGSALRSRVESGEIEHVTGLSITRLDVVDDRTTVTVVGQSAAGERRIEGVHTVVAATGFRPDLAMLSELRIDLDAALDAPSKLAPLIDPAVHTCGTVPPHGYRELAHPGEAGFFVAGMKSYGRAPTFLIATGNEQVRSIVAHLAGDHAAADEVRLVLPQTNDHPTSAEAGTDDVDMAHADGRTASLRLGYAAGRSADLHLTLVNQASASRRA